MCLVHYEYLYSNEKVTNLSVENAKSVGENIATEREASQNQLQSALKSGSERSERSDSRPSRKSKNKIWTEPGVIENSNKI